MLASLASRVRAPLNKTEVSSSVGIPRTSLDRYLTLLEHVFLVRRLPAWHTNRIKQITKAPKLLLSDSALLAHLLRADRERLADDDSLLGMSWSASSEWSWPSSYPLRGRARRCFTCAPRRAPRSTS